jgi:hypothetical protein
MGNSNVRLKDLWRQFGTECFTVNEVKGHFGLTIRQCSRILNENLKKDLVRIGKGRGTIYRVEVGA